MSSFEPITALQRGLDVLEVINQEKAVSLKTLHEETGLHKATLIRMLETLIATGYVAKTGRSRYVPTGRTLLLSQGYDLATRVSEIAGPALADFRRRIGWPSDIALYDDDSMIVVQSSRGMGPFYFKREKGYRAPILVTSIGRAFLAYCDTVHCNRIIDRLAQSSDPRDAGAHEAEALTLELAEIRAKGYATMDRSYSEQEYNGKIWGMAVPVRDHKNVYAAINILMLKNANTEEAVKRFLRPLQELGIALGKAIGSETPGTPLHESVRGPALRT